MRTYQPTVVGSTRKIVVIACLPQASIAQIAQISELPTVRGAPAHSVSYWPRPYVDASPAGTSYDRQDGNRAIERSATPWQNTTQKKRALCVDLAGQTMTGTFVEIPLTTPRMQCAGCYALSTSGASAVPHEVFAECTGIHAYAVDQLLRQMIARAQKLERFCFYPSSTFHCS